MNTDVIGARRNPANRNSSTVGGSGALADVVTVQRINTQGGAAQGACDRSGAFRSVPYSADYVFLRKGG